MLFLGACTEPGCFKIVMERLDGDLETLLLDAPAGKAIPLFARLNMAKQAAEGMNWLHLSEPAIIHRYLFLSLRYTPITNHDLINQRSQTCKFDGTSLLCWGWGE